jgi:hypothetical protein
LALLQNSVAKLAAMFRFVLAVDSGRRSVRRVGYPSIGTESLSGILVGCSIDGLRVIRPGSKNSLQNGGWSKGQGQRGAALKLDSITCSTVWVLPVGDCE